MNYEVLIHRKAQEYLLQLPLAIRTRIKNGLIELSDDPLTPRPNADIKKLSGTKGRKHAYRLRVGEYMVVYDVNKKKVYVTLIFPRGKEYQEL
jgi:mRNA interferase RelE/StbE